jgi:L-alanine-DL-glutamate epimerase-like enolase superfamily enzyme
MTRRKLLMSAAAVPAATLPAVGGLAKQMKITGLETDLLRFAPGRPYSDAIHTFGPDRGAVVLRITTDAGITGWAYSSFGMVAGGPKVVQTILEEECKPVLAGKDPAFPKRLRAELWRATEYHGVQGVAQFAIGAVDIALWDILGKAASLPVYRMLGAYHDRMPAYNMCGWYYENDGDLSQYRKSVAAALEEGFGAVKIKTGRFSLEDDVQRINAAKQLCGKERRIMVDANQGLNRNEALRRGRLYQELGCFWYEEPLPPHEKDGYAELARELDIRIATGENEYTKYGFLELLKRGAADVVQPDNRRAGGVTEWMEISAIADSFGVELASHGGGPTNMHMLLAMPNAIYIETESIRGDSSHVEKLRMENGAILAPEGAGMGSELRKDYIQKYKIG